MDCFAARAGKATVEIVGLGAEAFKKRIKRFSQAQRSWLKNTGFEGRPGQLALLPEADGSLARVLVGLPEEISPWTYAGLPARLPPGSYCLAGRPSQKHAGFAALGWALASYRFTRYKAGKVKPTRVKLVWPGGCDRKLVSATAEAVFLARDLINTPTEDLGPPELAAAARALSRQHGGRCSVIRGQALLQKNYPAVHAVGRAASRPPCLIDMQWGKPSHPRLTLVGKGVCFDSGGLDIKPASGMLLMKKDMGGAAHVLALAHMVMSQKLPVRLRVLIPAVENSISANAYRPGDVLQTRKGLTVEVKNTDAEGRLVLCDALAEASRDKPDLILDFATLTGAARVALGADLPALFCNDDGVASAWLKAGEQRHDPVWRLPLHAPYRRQLDSRIADLSNIGSGGYGGAITAALFLERFVDKGIPWAHIDVMAYNGGDRPGRPSGGEVMGLRSAFAMLSARYG